MRKTVENQENLTLRQTMIDEILVEDGKVVGVRTATHQNYAAKAVIVTTGDGSPWGNYHRRPLVLIRVQTTA